MEGDFRASQLDFHLGRISAKYNLDETEPFGDLKIRIENGEIANADIEAASAIVAAVSSTLVFETSPKVKPNTAARNQFRDFLRNKVPDAAWHSKHPEIKRKLSELKQKLKKLDLEEKEQVEKELARFARVVSRLYESSRAALGVSKALCVGSLVLIGASALGVASLAVPISLATLGAAVAYLMHRRSKTNAREEESKLCKQYEAEIEFIYTFHQNIRNNFFTNAAYSMDWVWKSFRELSNASEKERKAYLSGVFESVKDSVSTIVKENAHERGGAIAMLDSGPVFFEIENHSKLKIMHDAAIEIYDKFRQGEANADEVSSLKLILSAFMIRNMKEYSIEKNRKFIIDLQNGLGDMVDLTASEIKRGNLAESEWISQLLGMMQEDANLTYRENARSLYLISKGESPMSQVDYLKRIYGQDPIAGGIASYMAGIKFFREYNVLVLHSHSSRPVNIDEARKDMATDMRIAKREHHVMVCPSAQPGKSFEAWYIRPDDVELIGNF